MHICNVLDSIKQWLNDGQPYYVGVALLATYGSNKGLVEMFDQGPSPYRITQLEKHLRAIDAPLIITPEDAPIIITVEKKELPETQVHAADPFKDIWQPKYAEMQSLCHRLEDIATAEERGVAAFRILELEQECIRLWAKRDYFFATGLKVDAEDEQAISVTDKYALMQRLHNLRTYISRTKKKYKATPSSDLESKLTTYLTEEAIIITKINSLIDGVI